MRLKVNYHVEETCSCGAKFWLDALTGDVVTSSVLVWRATHRHDLPTEPKEETP